jgi:hypothetical protein
VPDVVKALMFPVPLDCANFPALDDGRILKLPWMLTSPPASGFSQTAPSTDIPIMSAVVPVSDVMLNIPSPTQQNPPKSGVLLQSSRLTVTLAFQLAFPMREAVSVPENLRQLHDPCDASHDCCAQVPIAELSSVPVPIMVNVWSVDEGLAVAVGVVPMMLVAVTVAVVDGVTSGNIPFPHPEFGSSNAAKAAVDNIGRRNRAIRRTTLWVTSTGIRS